jgi:hypothetical protein
MVFLVMNTWCSKHVVGTKNWIETLTQEMSQAKAPHCYLQKKNHVVHNYKRFESLKELNTLCKLVYTRDL